MLRSRDAAVRDRAKGLIVISSTVTPTNINAIFAGTAVPVIVAEHMLYDDFGLTADVGAHGVSAAKADVALTAAGAAHPIGAGIPAGQVVVTTSAQKLSWGRPAASATAIATLPAYSTNVSLFAYPSGRRWSAVRRRHDASGCS